MSGQGTHEAYQNLESNFFKVVIYNASIAFTAGGTGYLTKKVVRRFKLDRKVKLFRYQNSWHYILKGEFFDFPRTSFKLKNNDHKYIELVYLDALTDTNEGLILYEGILVDYELSADNGLNYITLKKAKRKFLDKNPDDTGKQSNIQGHIIILPFSQIKNINVSFYAVEESEGKADIRLVA